MNDSSGIFQKVWAETPSYHFLLGKVHNISWSIQKPLHKEAKTKSYSFWTKSCSRALDPSLPTTQNKKWLFLIKSCGQALDPSLPTTQNYHWYCRRPLLSIFSVQKGKVSSGLVKLHLQNQKFSLTSGIPPTLLHTWNMIDLRYLSF